MIDYCNVVAGFHELRIKEKTIIITTISSHIKVNKTSNLISVFAKPDQRRYCLYKDFFARF